MTDPAFWLPELQHVVATASRLVVDPATATVAASVRLWHDHCLTSSCSAHWGTVSAVLASGDVVPVLDGAGCVSSALTASATTPLELRELGSNVALGLLLKPVRLRARVEYTFPAAVAVRGLDLFVQDAEPVSAWLPEGLSDDEQHALDTLVAKLHFYGGGAARVSSDTIADGVCHAARVALRTLNLSRVLDDKITAVDVDVQLHVSADGQDVQGVVSDCTVVARGARMDRT